MKDILKDGSTTQQIGTPKIQIRNADWSLTDSSVGATVTGDGQISFGQAGTVANSNKNTYVITYTTTVPQDKQSHQYQNHVDLLKGDKVISNADASARFDVDTSGYIGKTGKLEDNTIIWTIFGQCKEQVIGGFTLSDKTWNDGSNGRS